jgi:hypothetical protein
MVLTFGYLNSVSVKNLGFFLGVNYLCHYYLVFLYPKRAFLNVSIKKLCKRIYVELFIVGS